MAMITNIQHLMDADKESENLPVEAQKLFNFLIAIIEAATKVYDDIYPFATASSYRHVTNINQCDGDVVVWISREGDQIDWGCTDCEGEGIITHWEGTKWDHRKFTRH